MYETKLPCPLRPTNDTTLPRGSSMGQKSVSEKCWFLSLHTTKTMNEFVCSCAPTFPFFLMFFVLLIHHLSLHRFYSSTFFILSVFLIFFAIYSLMSALSLKHALDFRTLNTVCTALDYLEKYRKRIKESGRGDAGEEMSPAHTLSISYHFQKLFSSSSCDLKF